MNLLHACTLIHKKVSVAHEGTIRFLLFIQAQTGFQNIIILYVDNGIQLTKPLHDVDSIT